MSLAEHAKTAYAHLTKTAHNPYDLDGARIFYIDDRGRLIILTHDPDVYNGLRDVLFTHLPPVTAIGIETCGWAAPLDPDGNPDGAPSEHPARRRVRLVTLINEQLESTSAMTFQDNPDEVAVDLGEGTGSLAEALTQVMLSIIMRRNMEQAKQN